jgi:hypothetical protein
MFARILFLLLLAANLGVGAWLWRSNRPAPPPPDVDPGVARLVLLAEREARDPDAASAELAAAPEALEAWAERRCLAIGPFVAQSDARRAVDLLTPFVERIRTREEYERQSRGFAVFLPAPATRDEALATARALQQRGVRDYYVVTAGPQQNTISLGLFSSRENAERRVAEVTLLGFRPAITERIDDRAVIFVDVVPSPDRPLDWRALLPDANLVERAIACF